MEKEGAGFRMKMKKGEREEITRWYPKFEGDGLQRILLGYFCNSNHQKNGKKAKSSRVDLPIF